MMRTLAIFLFAGSALPAQDLKILTPEMAGGPPKTMLIRSLKKQAFEALDRRQANFEKLKTPEQIVEYQQKLRAVFLESLGEFPERSPLNAKVVGTLSGDRYRIEKVIFESQPKHYVTAIVFVPEGKGPFPAVLMPAGHTSDGKVENQIQGMFLAQNGFVAMAYDPIGQGERHQFLDASGVPLVKGTTEHTLIGAASIPLGRNTATFRIWDGMRGLDYLQSRADVDPKKLGVTGCSGGGTLTSYLMALDERVGCAAPSCYITSWRRLLETLGPQDAEQNIFGQIASGLDHADYLHLRAPRPTLILAATHDFFDIQGTWTSFRESVRLYQRLGERTKINLIETDNKHGYPRAQREEMVRWMSRWLLDKDEPIREALDLKARKTKEYLCTPEGETMRLPGARSIADLNADLDARYAEVRKKIWEDKKSALDKVRAVTGIRPLAKIPAAKVNELGELEGGRSKGSFETKDGVLLPVLFTPAMGENKGIVLLVHGDGMASALKADGLLASFAKQGYQVAALDVRGMGELGTSGEGMWGGAWNDIFVSYLLGKSLVALRTEDMLVAARTWSEYGRKVHLVAIGVAGVPALHAAALEPQLFASVKIEKSLDSWSGLVRNPLAPGHLVNVVHGALKVYDLPDLRASLPAGMLTIVDPVHAQQQTKK